MLRELARRPRRPERAFGLDNSTGMLARAGGLPPRWQLLRADAEHLPFAGGSFDVVTAAYLLHLLGPEARARILGEVHRVLRPGGRLGVITVAPPQTRLGTWLSWPIRQVATRSRGALAGLRPLDAAPDLAAVGFQITAQRRVGRGYPSLCAVAIRCR